MSHVLAFAAGVLAALVAMLLVGWRVLQASPSQQPARGRVRTASGGIMDAKVRVRESATAILNPESGAHRRVVNSQQEPTP